MKKGSHILSKRPQTNLETNNSGGISKQSIGLLAIVLLLIVAGQFFSKSGSDSLSENYSVYGLAFVGAGYFMLALRGVVWVLLLRKMDLSLAYPLQSVSYILVMLLSFFVFEEQIMVNHIVGCGLILLGTLAIVR